jgi:uncharacterized protein YlxP (DUF503 family)
MNGFVCLVELRLHYGESHSLKGKRKELVSLKALLRQRFGASVAEIGGHDTWQSATLLCALTGDHAVEARGAELVRFAESRCADGCGARIKLFSMEDLEFD